MGFVLIDLIDEKKSLHVNFWNWHPTVELVKDLGVLDSARNELMHQQCNGVTIAEEEAHKIAQGLRTGVLTKLGPNDRVRLDLSVTSEPDDEKMHYGADAEKNYSATFKWLTGFAQFCSECRGFKVL